MSKAAPVVGAAALAGKVPPLSKGEGVLAAADAAPAPAWWLLAPPPAPAPPPPASSSPARRGWTFPCFWCVFLDWGVVGFAVS